MGICCKVVVFLVKKNKKNFRTEQFLTIAGDVFLYLTPLLIHMRLHGLTGRFYTSVIPKSQVQTSSGPSSVIGLYDPNWVNDSIGTQKEVPCLDSTVHD